MPCTLFGPLTTLPDIFPLSLEPPTIDFSGDLTLCCKLLQFDLDIPIPLGPLVINSTLMALINAQIAIANNYIRLLAFPCPRE